MNLLQLLIPYSQYQSKSSALNKRPIFVEFTGRKTSKNVSSTSWVTFRGTGLESKHCWMHKSSGGLVDLLQAFKKIVRYLCSRKCFNVDLMWYLQMVFFFIDFRCDIWFIHNEWYKNVFSTWTTHGRYILIVTKEITCNFFVDTCELSVGSSCRFRQTIN